MFSWLHGLLCPKVKSQIIVGAAALYWALWLNRNDMIFNKAISDTYIHVIFRTIYWIKEWSMLHREEDQPLLKMGCS